jgi:hypothetical protein
MSSILVTHFYIAYLGTRGVIVRCPMTALFRTARQTAQLSIRIHDYAWSLALFLFFRRLACLEVR